MTKSGSQAGLRRHLSFANVASALALFAALGGGSAMALSGGGGATQTKAKLPSGTVVRGVVGGTDHTSADPGGVRALASLPRGARLPAGATDTAVTVEDGDDDAEHNCAGSSPAPTAPRGVVCIYVQNAVGADQIDGQVIPGVRFGFILDWRPGASTQSRVEATWAYKVP
jgi:hypothetical protein